jgi:hypothetical protein
MERERGWGPLREEGSGAFDREKNSFGASGDTVSAGKDSLGAGKD